MQASTLTRDTMRSPGVLSVILEVWAYRHVLSQLVRQQLVLRYRRTVFGYLWTLLNPLLTMSVTSVVFSTIFKMDLRTYAVFLFSGMVAFLFFSNTVTQGCQTLLGNESLIKKVYIPKLVFPLSTSISTLVDSVLMMVSLFLLVLLFGAKITPSLLFLPVAYVLLFMFSFGAALLVSVTSVYLRDLQYLIGIVLQALQFLTPIYYRPESLQGKVAWLIQLNPLTAFVELFRAPLYYGQMPSGSVVLTCAVLSGVVLLTGIAVFRRCERLIAFRL